MWKLVLLWAVGNLYRGSQLQKDGLVGRVTGDQMGMLATVMNGLTMRDAFVRRNIKTRLMSALPIGTVVESYLPRCNSSSDSR